MAYDPSAVYENLYGHAPDKPVPAEFRIFNKVADGMLASADQHGSSVVRQVAIIATRNGLAEYLQYVFFAFAENRRNWPNMLPYLDSALMMGRWVMNQASAVPNYSDGLQTPPVNLEDAVDKTLIELAKWCATDLRKSMILDYFKILNANANAYAKMKSEITIDKASVYLGRAFEQRAYSTPAAIHGGDDISRLVRFFGI
jgi:hypothetical protein